MDLEADGLEMRFTSEAGVLDSLALPHSRSYSGDWKRLTTCRNRRDASMNRSGFLGSLLLAIDQQGVTSHSKENKRI